MSFWRGVVYGLGLSQVFLMLGVELMYPPARVQTWLFTPCVANGTLVHGCGAARPTSFGLQVPCLVAAAAAAVFVSNSYGLAESGRMTNECTFCQEAVVDLGLWDTGFWVTVALCHLVILLMACSPGDLYLVAWATYLLVSGLWALCRPRDNEQAPPDPGQIIYNVLAIMAGVGLAAVGVPAGYSDRYVLLIPVVLLDYILGIGHVWERGPTMETVCNCRVFHACFSAVTLAVMYSAWHERLQVPSPHDTDTSEW